MLDLFFDCGLENVENVVLLKIFSHIVIRILFSCLVNMIEWGFSIDLVTFCMFVACSLYRKI
jgi:hypothetical protein